MESIRDFWRNNQIFSNFVQNKRNLTSLLVLVFIALSLPLGLFLLKQQQTYRSNAAGELIQLVEGPCVQTINNKKTALCNSISLKLFNPFATTSASPSPTSVSTSSANPSPTSQNASPSPSPSAVTSCGSPRTIRATTPAQMKQALDDLECSGGAVYIPAGNYSLTENLSVPSNVTLFGDGDSTVLTMAAHETGISNKAVRGGDTNVVIRDLKVIGDGGDLSGGCCYGIRLRSISNSFIINVTVEAFSGDGIALTYKHEDGVPKGVKNTRITGCKLSRNDRQQIGVIQAEGVVIDNCSIDADGWGNGIDLEPDAGGDTSTNSNKILNNTIFGPSAGITLLGAGGESGDPNVVRDNAVCNNNVTVSGSKYSNGGINNIFVGNQGGNIDTISGGNTLNGPASACDIPTALATLPAVPSKPAAMKINNSSFLSWLPNFEVKALAASMSATPSASVAPSGASYRLAETQEGLAQANWVSYTSSPIVTNFSVSNTPGPKQIWVEFRSPSGQTITDHLNTFDLLAPAPVITGVNCTLDLTNKNLKIQVLGTNLGAQKGTLTANGTTLETASWDNSTVVGLLTTTATQTGQKYSVIIRRADTLQSTAQSCQVNTSTISLGARVFCRAEGQFDVSNVKVTIAPIETPEKTIEETATIDKDGTIQGIKTKLQSGKQYIISAKGPNTLRRNTVVTAQEGTTVANTSDGKPFILPIGDIAPSTPDGQINGLDRAELVRQWRILSSSASGTLSGDFNRDKKVNSIDWACMKYDFNSKDDDPGNTTGSTYTNGVNFSAGQGSLIFTY